MNITLPSLLDLLILAFAAIGTVAWYKSLSDALLQKKWKSVQYSLVAVVVSFLVSWSYSKWDLSGGLSIMFILLSMSELGYQLIIQTVLGLIKKLVPTEPPKGQ